MTAVELFKGLTLVRVPHGGEELEIDRVVTSPAQAGPHTLYVACRTAIANGRFGADVAVARGCRAFLCCNDIYPGEGAFVWIADEPERLLGELAARVCGHPARQMTVLVITGSAGKTSVALQTVQILRYAGKRVSALTSDGLDLLGECTPPCAVVPDAAYIQHALWQMAQCGSEIAVLEFSSYQLKHFAAQSIPFTAVLLTNLYPRHVGVGEHESLEAYREAKLSLLSAPSAFYVLPAGLEIQTQTSARVLRVGEAGDVWAENVCVENVPAQAPQMRFSLCTRTEKHGGVLPFVGNFAAENALNAATLCRIVGLDMAQIVGGFSSLHAQGRMECIAANYGRLVFLDAAFLPQDLECVLTSLRALSAGRLCVLLGSVGGRAKARRAALARVAERFADHLYLSADDPDMEDPLQICSEMRDAMCEPMRADVITDRRTAILRAVREMRGGDLLLILAKPAPAGQLVGGRLLPFDERQIVKEAFSEF